MGPTIAPTTTVGEVRLGVADLSRSVDYYTNSIGLIQRSRDGDTVHLGTVSETLVAVEQEPGAVPARSYAGLFHLAILVPDRESLGRWLAHALRDGVPLDGASDHTVSEALYLSDPDGHGIEIYRDRPRSEWEGRVGELMGTAPLDHRGLLAAGGEEASYGGMPQATTMGHVHLQVSEIPATVEFYRDVLGFEIMAMWDSAAFLGAGGYHHHIGANTWNSRGRGPAPAGSASLRAATIEVAGDDELARLERRLTEAGHGARRTGDVVETTDPSGIPLRLVTGDGA